MEKKCHRKLKYTTSDSTYWHKLSCTINMFCTCRMTTNTTDFLTMTDRAYSTKITWYVEYKVTGPTEQKKKYEGEAMQKPAVRNCEINEP